MKTAVLLSIYLFFGLQVYSKSSTQIIEKTMALQQLENAEVRAKNLTKFMVKKLALTSDQEPKVYLINLEKAKKIDEKKASKLDNKKAMNEFIDTIEKERDIELKEVLTLEQFKKWVKIKLEQKKKLEKENKGKETEEYINEGKMQDGC